LENQYARIIEEAAEEPNVDFKKAMAWAKEFECERFELLKHIAAMCTYGGGVLIIGRNDDDKRSGSLTVEQQQTFEPTRVNEYARNWLKPLPAIKVVTLEVGSDRLVVLDIPGFRDSPPCFQEASQCANPLHRETRRHFSRGDVYVRTAASQTARVADPEDWRTIWNQMAFNVRQSLNVGGNDDSSADDPYLEEDRRDEAGHRAYLPIPDSTARIEIVVRPVRYLPDRISRLELKNTLERIRARVVPPGQTTVQAMPYDYGSEVRTFSDGVVLYTQAPQARLLETVQLRTSGSFRLTRIFPEEFRDGTLQQPGPALPLIGLAIDLTLAWEVVALLARKTSANDAEKFDVEVAVAGIANRRFDDDSLQYGARIPLSLTLGEGTQSMEARVPVTRRVTGPELAERHRDLAVESYQEILWLFGLEPSASTVSNFQKAFQSTEPSARALPSNAETKKPS
jgi:hypothetical protein